VIDHSASGDLATLWWLSWLLDWGLDEFLTAFIGP